MSSFNDRTTRSRVPLALRGLTQKDLVSLYNQAIVRRLRPGEVVFREGDVDGCFWFVLDGSLGIKKHLNGQTKQIGIVSRGHSVEEVVPRKDQKRAATAMATEPSAVIGLDADSLDRLSPEANSTIYKNLNDLGAERLWELIEKQGDMERRNRQLISSVRDYLRSRHDAYVHSENVQKALEGFPRLPMYASKLAVRLLDENVTATEVVDLTKFDPSLVSMVLKTVNSSYYNLQRKISDIQQAVLFLGFSQIYQLVMTEGIRSVMPRGPEYQRLLFHSVLMSLLGFEIARVCNLKNATHQNTVGLLHDIGKSIILLLSKQHPELAMTVDPLGHGKIGSLLLRQWNIPEPICLTLEYQHDSAFLPPEEIPPGQREHVAVVYLGHLCEACLQGGDEKEPLSPFHDEYLGLLKVSEKSVAEFVRKKVLPLMTKRRRTYPEEVRRFLLDSEDRMMDGLSDTKELPITWNI
jgi:HD-like signal output (HDOD) protein